ncbi:T9SS type A sorting domain-containing protein [Dinghuibacter silviterrae]|uniref:Putative secreted protein (Por secretion system target) n=1 Tax=Dinghuibacter silviterrae TaxID=1539049 RepID=A0A4R8DH55_9BACT|nr:T9SS type A sorting domain-containing protein [Dinghuibacter silviterrae]TDW96827.1 putative secreted protein (Por secretion system target) [Dinghuibacter silviterrae]
MHKKVLLFAWTLLCLLQVEPGIGQSAKPVNDECTGAINIPTNGSTSDSLYTLFRATLSMTPCTGTAARDIWFKFTATSTLHKIWTQATDSLPVVVQVFQGSCGSLTSLICDNHANGEAEVAHLTVGDTYYYRVYLAGGNIAQPDIKTFVMTETPSPNDEVTEAKSIKTDTLYHASLYGSTQSLPSCNNTGSLADDIWFSFVPKTKEARVVLTPPAAGNYVFQVFSGTPGNLTSLACVADTSSLITGLTPGSTYYIRVYASVSYAIPYYYPFGLEVKSILPPVNDECTGAISISTGGTSYDSLHTLEGATLSMPACTGTAASDIWFTFTATGTRHKIWATATDSLPVVVQVFQGSCGSLTSLACDSHANGEVELSSLTVGTRYYYRVYLAGGNTAMPDIKTYVTAVAPPSNDEATGAKAIKTDTLYHFTLAGATQSQPPCADYGNLADDIWYSFVPTTNTAKIILTPPTSVPAYYVFQVFSGTPGSLTSLACIADTSLKGADSTILSGLTPGSAYYIRVYNSLDNGSVLTPFGLEVKPIVPPVNDECTGAINIPPGGSTYDSLYTLAGATLSMPACTGSAARDVWFKFTATTSTLHKIGVQATDSLPVVVQVFQGSCGNLTSLSCNSYPNGQVELKNLTAGATYYYRVYLAGGNTAETNIKTTVSSMALATNDEVTGARAIKTDTLYRSSLLGATQSMSPCYSTGNLADDIWFSFVPTTNRTRIILTPSTLGTAQYVFQVFSGTPGNLTSLACVADTSFRLADSVIFHNLTIGSTYYIRVYNSIDFGSALYPFGLEVKAMVSPVNDECTGAINIPANNTVNDSLYTLAGATLSMPACTSTAYSDIWFKFTATATRHIVHAVASNSHPTVVQVFKGSCGSLTSLYCFNYSNGDANLVNLVPGTTYYYRVYLAGGDSTETFINTSVTTPGSAPSNDEVTGAKSLVIDSTYSLVLGAATQSMPPCNNSGNEADDVWYSFVATANTLGIALVPNNASFDYAFQVFSGTPGQLTSLLCFENPGTENATIGGLTTGQTYYMRVYNNDGLSSNLFGFSLKILSDVGTVVASMPDAAASDSAVSVPGTTAFVYPNPAHDYIYVKRTGTGMPVFSIVDMTGRTYLTGRLLNPVINISRLPTGCYVLVIRDMDMVRKSILFIKE